MKPRIRRRFGIWYCAIWFPDIRMWYRPIGHGYNPVEAYKDWEAQQ